MKITTEITIGAAHMVHTVETKCYHLHGHNWKFVVDVEGDMMDDGMVVDYGDIKQVFKDIDHKVWFPNEVENDECDTKMLDYFIMMANYGDAVVIPVPVITSEWMALWAAKKICGLNGRIKKVKVTCYEGEKSYAEKEWGNHEGE